MSDETTKPRKPRAPRDLSIELGPEITAELERVLSAPDSIYNREAARNRVRAYAQRVAIDACRGYIDEIVRTGGKTPAARRAAVDRSTALAAGKAAQP